MKQRSVLLFLFVWLLAPVASSLVLGATAPCESLAGLHLPNTSITTAQTVAAGSFRAPAPQFKNLPSFCRVAGAIKP
ncbi:MAG: hypothetical protein ACREP9_15125, partial [Candidatus Dormibacteraceae bacterium]